MFGTACFLAYVSDTVCVCPRYRGGECRCKGPECKKVGWHHSLGQSLSPGWLYKVCTSTSVFQQRPVSNVRIQSLGN